MKKTEKKFYKLKIEGVLGLAEIAEEFELTTTELIAFHNQHCALHELLPLSLPKYVEYIYLPPQIFLERDKKLLKSTKLVLPEISSEKTYGVRFNFLPKELSIHYTIILKRTQQFLEISKEKSYVNNQEIDKIIEQLFEKAEQVLYPLQISVNKNGAISKIENSEEIAKRWSENCRPKLAEYYQAETSNEILNKIDSVLKNADDKTELLERNLFYKLFFLPVYQSYSKFSKSDLLYIYFSSLGQSIGYEVEFDLNMEFTHGNKIALKIDGKESDNPFSNDQKKGEIHLLYKFQKYTFEIFSITGIISCFDSGKEQKIDFALYEL